jgi:hypothetical protein
VLYFVGPALNVWVALYRARVAGGMAFLRLLSHVRTGRVRHRLRHPIEPTSLETQLAAQSTASRRLRPLMTTSQRCSRNCGPNTSRGRALKAVCSQPMSENISASASPVRRCTATDGWISNGLALNCSRVNSCPRETKSATSMPSSCICHLTSPKSSNCFGNKTTRDDTFCCWAISLNRLT